MRPPGTVVRMVQYVDWELAAVTAKTLGKSGPPITYAEATEVVTQLRRLSAEAEGHVRAYTGLTPTGAPAQVRVVDRADWAAVNISGLSQIITPLVEQLAKGREPGPMMAAVGGRITGLQAGTVLAYLSGRVLGQYEVFSSNPGQLLLVAPNVVEAERRLDVDPHDFRLWVCLHEVTHLTQFTAVPWMRAHFFDEVQSFVDASQIDGEQMLDRLRKGLAALADVVRDPDSRASLLDIVQNPAQKAVLDRLTALMTLLEGHAEFVMDGVGPEVVPSVEAIREKFNRRRGGGNPLERMVRKLLGIDVKMRQYAEGRKFVHAVVDRVGMAGFNRIWESPVTLPRLSEIGDPQSWIDRVPGAE
jgi:coenzyme F420 biosynthesis associated uncharacterized protein